MNHGPNPETGAISSGRGNDLHVVEQLLAQAFHYSVLILGVDSESMTNRRLTLNSVESKAYFHISAVNLY